MKRTFTLALAMVLALVNISTASAASIKGKKLSFSTGWNASMEVPATETRVYTFVGKWESASTSLSGIDPTIYKSFTVDCEATAGAWFNMPVKDANGDHYPGFAGDGQRGEHTIIFADVDDGLTGPLSGFGVQNCSDAGVETHLTIYNAYLTKHNGATEGVILGASQWTSGSSFNYANPITSAPVHYSGQWGGLNLYGANDIECGIKLRIYAKNVIAYDNLQFCVKFADDNKDGWPQLTKITDTYAECVIDRPLSSLALQWRGTVAGDLDIQAITFERLDGQSAGDDETGNYDFFKLTDVKTVPGIQSFSTEFVGGANHNHSEYYQEALHPLNGVQFNIEEEAAAKARKAEEAEEAKEDPSIRVAIKKLNGTKVCLATAKLVSDMLVVEADEALEAGDYKVTFAPETFIINDQVYTDELSFIVAALDESNQLVEDAKMTVKSEVESVTNIKNALAYGVNVFQYSPGLKQKIENAIEEAEYYSDLYAEEENVYSALSDLRKYMKSVRPNLPKADSEYAIKNKQTGLYLNISDNKATLEKDPYPIQFHLTEASEGPWDSEYAKYDQTYWTSHHCYIYSTPERKYLGYEKEDREEEIEGETYTYRELVTTNKKNYEWLVEYYGGNCWYLSVPNPNNRDHYWLDLGMKYEYDEDGEEVDYEGSALALFMSEGDDEDLDNESSANGYTTWFIEEYVAPEVVINLPEGYEAITSEDDLEGQTVMLMNVETSEFIYGSNAQNIAVADFETATNSANVVTAYKVEKDENGFLFRCVTPAGGDYSLWGANPCYFNSQPNAGGVTFNLGKHQDIANGSTWTLTFDKKVQAWIFQSVANNAYLAGSTVSEELTAKWVICTSTTGAGSSSADDATAITSVNATSAVEVYNASGVRTNTLGKGVNIVKLANGKVVKVVK